MLSEERKREIDKRLAEIEAIWSREAEQRRKKNEKQKSFDFQLPALKN